MNNAIYVTNNVGNCKQQGECVVSYCKNEGWMLLVWKRLYEQYEKSFGVRHIKASKVLNNKDVAERVEELRKLADTDPSWGEEYPGEDGYCD